MHGLGMAHRDLKVENILVSYSTADDPSNFAPVFKLGDFGSTTKEHSIDFDKAEKRDIGRFLELIEE